MQAKVIVITGASTGIGAATAERLASKGHSVVLAARRKEALDAVAARCGENALPIVADVAVRAENQRVLEAALERFGHVDVWTNNVGRGTTRMPTQLTDEDVYDMIQLNVMTALYGMQTVLPHFKSRNTGQIINVSSLLGRIPYVVGRSAYSGAKHFLNALTANFREEVQQTHPEIRFSLVSPGVVRTEFGINAKHGGPDSREIPYSQSAEEVAEVIAKVVESGAQDVYTREGFHDRVVSYYDELAADP